VICAFKRELQFGYLPTRMECVVRQLRPLIFVANLLSVGIVFTGIPAGKAVDANLEAASMVVSPPNSGGVISDSTASTGSALFLWSNGSASKNLSLSESKGVVVRAKGDSCRGAPTMTVSVDDKNIATLGVSSTSWTDYRIVAAIPAGSHTLAVAFTNDDAIEHRCDRNLKIDKLTIVGLDSPSTTSASPTTATMVPSTPTITSPPAGTATAADPFAINSAFRTRIAAGAALDANSPAMVARLSRDDAMYANLVEYGIPIYLAGADSPRYSVRCTITDWGTCPVEGMQVPIPNDAKPNTGSDGILVVVDESARKSYEFWQAQFSGGQWTASWAGTNSLDGSGWGGAGSTGSGTGSGASRLGGVIRMAEIQKGDIPHALVVQTDSVCANAFRAPGWKTDGTSTRTDCIPEGARIRLDPAVDLDSLTLAPAVLAVARALQLYGAYVVDGGGAPISVSFELDPTATSDSIGGVYEQAGLRWDYDSLSGVPWDRLQVLA
jgi:Ca-dependent carbohydrate-binding module xylan-binding